MVWHSPGAIFCGNDSPFCSALMACDSWSSFNCASLIEPRELEQLEITETIQGIVLAFCNILPGLYLNLKLNCCKNNIHLISLPTTSFIPPMMSMG